MIAPNLPWLEAFSEITGICLLSALFSKCKPATLEERKKYLEKKYQEFKEDFSAINDITVEQLLQLGDKENFVLIDLRSEEEREVSIIPGALTSEVFEQNLNRSKGHTAVTYCTTGTRSGLYAKKLQERHLPVRNLVGGVIAWALEGQLFENFKGKCNRVHVFKKNWNILPDEYDAVW